MVLALWTMIAYVPFMLTAAALDGLFGWGVVDATRAFLDPFIPDGLLRGSDDPGDCDRRYGAC